MDGSTEQSTSSNTNGDDIKIDESFERDTYFQALRLWIQQAQLHQSFSACLPYYLMNFQNNSYQSNHLSFLQQVQGNQNIRFNNAGASPAQVIAHNGGFEYIIPPLYKRLLAEILDFLLLFFVKLALTFVAVDIFELIDITKIDIDEIAKNVSEEDYRKAFEMTSDIIIIEIAYRFLVCFYEAWCIAFGFSGARLNGATPGKAILGLRVVYATAIVSVPNRPRETVLIYPATHVSFWIALLRSLCKNFLISLLFPLCLVLFVFPHNRTGYDLICNVIVVEENMFPPRRNRP